MAGTENKLDVVANQLAIKDLLLRVLQENRENNTEIRQNYDEMRQDIAGMKAQLHIIRHNMNKPESPVLNIQRFTPSSKGRAVKFEDDLSGDETLHKECIQQHLEHIIEDLDLDGSSLIDHLIEDSCLSGEEAAMLKTSDRRNQNRKLSLMISHRSKEKFHRFLKHLETDFPHIHQKLSESYDSKLKAGKRPSECVICAIKKNVNIAHVVDKLCSKNVVDLEFYEVYCSSSNSLTDQSNLWEIIFAIIDQARDRRGKIKLLQEALSQKYEHISTKLNSLWAPRMKCQCFKVNSTQQQSDDSVGSTAGYRSTLSTQRLEDSVHLSSSLDTIKSSNITNIPSTVKWVMDVDETCTVTTNSSDQDFSYLDNQHLNDGGYSATVDEAEDISSEKGGYHKEDMRKRPDWKKSTFNVKLDTDSKSTNTEPTGVCGDHIQDISKSSKRRQRPKKNKGRKQNENETGDSTNTEGMDGTTPVYDSNRNPSGNLVSTKNDHDKTDLILAELQNVPTSASDTCPVSPGERHLMLSSATPKKTSDTRNSFPQTGSKHPEYVTEQTIITASKSVDPSYCDIQKQTDYVSPTNNKKTKKKKQK